MDEDDYGTHVHHAPNEGGTISSVQTYGGAEGRRTLHTVTYRGSTRQVEFQHVGPTGQLVTISQRTIKE